MHYIRDKVFGEDTCRGCTGMLPRVLDMLSNLAITICRPMGVLIPFHEAIALAPQRGRCLSPPLGLFPLNRRNGPPRADVCLAAGHGPA